MNKFRLIAKCTSLPFVIVGVLIFIFQLLPTYFGRGIVLYIFIAGGIFWALDTVFSFLDDMNDIKK